MLKLFSSLPIKQQLKLAGLTDDENAEHPLQGLLISASGQRKLVATLPDYKQADEPDGQGIDAGAL